MLFLILTIKQALKKLFWVEHLIDAFLSWQTSHHFIKVCQPWNWWSPLRFAWTEPPHVRCGAIGAWSRNDPPGTTWNVAEKHDFVFPFFFRFFFFFFSEIRVILWDKRWFWVWIAFVDRYSACIYSVSQSYYTALLLNTITLQISKEAQMRIKWSLFFHTWTVCGISWHRFKWANFGIFGDWVGTGYRITVLRWSHVKVFLCLEEKWNILTADAFYTILNVFKTRTKLLWFFRNLSVK